MYFWDGTNSNAHNLSILIRFSNDIAKKVLIYLPHYHFLFVQDLKKKTYNVIGYAKKSQSNEDDKSCTQLLQHMARGLQEG